MATVDQKSKQVEIDELKLKIEVLGKNGGEIGTNL
jgi:hypothetical protein